MRLETYHSGGWHAKLDESEFGQNESMRLMRVIVHVGMPKTGSTAIQNFLQVNKHHLVEQHIVVMKPYFPGVSQYEFAIIGCNESGELVPDKIDRTRLGIQSLEDQKKVTASFERKFDEGLQDLNDKTLVISCEQIGFWLRSSSNRLALDGWLRQRFSRVEYVMLVRSMDSFLLSVHSEAILRGSTLSLDQFVAREREQPMVKTALEWKADFGERLRVEKMCYTAGAREGLYDQFCRILGVQIQGLAQPKPKNTSLNTLQRLFLRKLNGMLGPLEGRRLSKKVAWRAGRLLSQFFLSWAPKCRLTETQVALINRKYPNPLEVAVDGARRE
jgi:hypothetical protein